MTEEGIRISINNFGPARDTFINPRTGVSWSLNVSGPADDKDQIKALLSAVSTAVQLMHEAGYENNRNVMGIERVHPSQQSRGRKEAPPEGDVPAEENGPVLSGHDEKWSQWPSAEALAAAASVKLQSASQKMSGQIEVFPCRYIRRLESQAGIAGFVFGEELDRSGKFVKVVQIGQPAWHKEIPDDDKEAYKNGFYTLRGMPLLRKAVYQAAKNTIFEFNRPVWIYVKERNDNWYLSRVDITEELDWREVQ